MFKLVGCSSCKLSFLSAISVQSPSNGLEGDCIACKIEVLKPHSRTRMYIRLRFGSSDYCCLKPLRTIRLKLARVLKTIVIHTLVSFLIYGFRFLNSVFYVRGNP